MADAQHTYVPLMDCLADLLGHGFDFKAIPQVRPIDVIRGNHLDIPADYSLADVGTKNLSLEESAYKISMVEQPGTDHTIVTKPRAAD